MPCNGKYIHVKSLKGVADGTFVSGCGNEGSCCSGDDSNDGGCKSDGGGNSGWSGCGKGILNIAFHISFSAIIVALWILVMLLR